MNRLILSIVLFLMGSNVFSQVGINTQMPKATLDVVASPTDATKIDGLIVPRLTGNELKAKDALYLAPQTGTVVYIMQPASPTTTKTAKVTSPGYYYFDGSAWQSFIGPNIYNADGVLLANRTVTMGTNTLQFTNGSNSIGLNNNGTQSTLSVLGSSTGYIQAQGGSAMVDMLVSDSNAAQIIAGGTAAKFLLGTSNATPLGFSTNTQQRAVISSTGNFGINTPNPTHKLHVAPSAGEDPVKIEGLNQASGAENNVVVDLSTGILKYSPTVAQPVFHAKLAANQSGMSSGASTVFFSAPEITSSLYSYNTTTGVLTFNVAGNYLIQMQISFRDIDAGAQMTLGIRSGGNYIGRGTTYSPVARAANITVGSLAAYNTVIPATAGMQITFAVASNEIYGILKNEDGGSGSGNVSNVTVIKL